MFRQALIFFAAGAGCLFRLHADGAVQPYRFTVEHDIFDDGLDEIGIFPQHGATLAAALEKGDRATFKAAVADQFEFPVQSSVIPWLRACARRNGIALEPVGQ